MIKRVGTSQEPWFEAGQGFELGIAILVILRFAGAWTGVNDA